MCLICLLLGKKNMFLVSLLAWWFCRAGRTSGEAARKIKTNLLALSLPSPTFIREFKIRQLRTTNYGWTSVVLCLQHWVELRKYRTLRSHYRQQTTSEEAERETTCKDFLVFMFSSEKYKYFACDLIFRIMNKFFYFH